MSSALALLFAFQGAEASAGGANINDPPGILVQLQSQNWRDREAAFYAAITPMEDDPPLTNHINHGVMIEPGLQKALVRALEMETRSQFDDSDNIDERSGYVSDLIGAVGSVGTPAATDALLIPYVFKTGHGAIDPVALQGNRVFPEIIQLYYSSSDRVYRAAIAECIVVMLESRTLKSEPYRLQARNLFLRLSEDRNEPMRVIAVGGLSFFTDKESFSRLQYLEKNDSFHGVINNKGYYPVRDEAARQIFRQSGAGE